MKRIIKNVGVLDIRNASEESIKDILTIGNVGTVIYNRKTASILSKLNIVNLGSSMEVPDKCCIYTGQVSISHNMIQAHTSPATMVVTGQLVFLSDVTEEDIEKSIDRIVMTGQILCPENILLSLQSRLTHMTGQLLSYRDGTEVVTGTLSFDNSYLNSLKSPVSLMVFGKINLSAEIDIKLFEEKIKEINLFGKIITREEYLEVLYGKLKDKKSQKMEIIPRGYICAEEELNLDKVSLKRFDGACIYARQTVRFAGDISSDDLVKHIKSMKTCDVILCHENLREAVISINDSVSPKIISYKGRLIEVDNEHTLTQSEIEYSPEKITYVVRGEMEVSPEAEPKLMMEKIEAIDNFGEITADEKQLGVISLLMRTREGELIHRGKEKQDDTVEIGNVGVFNL
ncbi:MAG: hypothetical protein ABRQ39_25245 [Candidatus Eremiobacterota bacterium]